MTKVIDVLTQKDFHGAFEKLLEWHNKNTAAESDYFKGDMYVLSIKESILKKSGNLSYDPRIYVFLFFRKELKLVYFMRQTDGGRLD